MSYDNCKLSKFIFSKQLADIVLKNHYIPRRIKENEHLKQYHRYWSTYSQMICKVLEIYYVKNSEYYTVKMDSCLYGEITYPLPKDYVYELKIDYKNLDNLWIINNSKLSLSGAEIRYWFFIKNIDFNDPEYGEFWSYLNYNSKSSISDDKFYFVKSFKDSYGNTHCKVSIDKRKK